MKKENEIEHRIRSEKHLRGRLHNKENMGAINVSSSLLTLNQHYEDYQHNRDHTTAKAPFKYDPKLNGLN